MKAVYARHRLDATIPDILHGLSACVWARDEGALARQVLRACFSEDDGIVCLSVRSGFDLLLEALALPEGSEALVSAITHPDMARILVSHRLVPVPVDLDPETLAPRPDLLENALTQRSKVLLVAHLFGGRVDLDPIARFAREHDLLLVEDSAQNFRGPGKMADHRAHVSMYSFGPIKTATAFGGAVLRVRDPGVLERMRATQTKRVPQSRREYAAKLLKFLLLALISRPMPYGLLVSLCSLFGGCIDNLAGGAARSFPRGIGADLPKILRRRPSAPLLAMLARRLHHFDGGRLKRRAFLGEKAARLLESSVALPGRFSRDRTHWLFPILAGDPDTLVRTLRGAGFDASRATSNITAVEPPAVRPDLAPKWVKGTMENMVFLPVYPELPEAELQRLVESVGSAIGKLAHSKRPRPLTEG